MMSLYCGFDSNYSEFFFMTLIESFQWTYTLVAFTLKFVDFNWNLSIFNQKYHRLPSPITITTVKTVFTHQHRKEWKIWCYCSFQPYGTDNQSALSFLASFTNKTRMINLFLAANFWQCIKHDGIKLIFLFEYLNWFNYPKFILDYCPVILTWFCIACDLKYKSTVTAIWIISLNLKVWFHCLQYFDCQRKIRED